MRPDRTQENQEKRRVAMSSVLAGLFLTIIKLAGGHFSGSLGILAEAAHSALDVGAAALTYFAVRASSKPPDEEHNYGHQRIENLSALAETALLFITCVWILYEAIRRLIFADVHVAVSAFAFVVMAVSIVTDYSRSRALRRVARLYKSQALEADALHFSTDMASAAVVLVGLGLVGAGRLLGAERILERADAVAALGVAAIVIQLSVRLGRQSIDVLLDAAPQGLREAVAAAAVEVPGVLECHRVRVRRSGADQFVDLVIVTHGASSVEVAHRIADRVEDRIRSRFPRTDVVVHIEPVSSWPDAASAVRGLAARRGLTIHDLAVHEGAGEMSVDLHVEVPEGILLSEAHGLVAPLEEDIRRVLPRAASVNIHLDPIDAGTIRGQEDEASCDAIRPFLQETLAGLPEIREVHDLRVRRDGRRLYVSVHAVFDGSAPVEAVHRAAEALEARLRRRFPEILRVLVHTEPQAASR